MNHTTPLAPDDIAVLRARQLQATKHRVLAELRACDVTKTTLQYRADPFGSGDVDVKGIDSEDNSGIPLVLEHNIENAFYDLNTLVERFVLDLLAHFHSGFEIDGGKGFVTIDTERGAVRIEHTDIETNEVSSENNF